MKKEYLAKLIKEIRAGRFNDWAENYIEDVNAPNEVKPEDMNISEVLNSVTDFLESRRIELEE